MDRRLKERLVGATILVVLIVLIVPELLSGPHRPSTKGASNSGSTETVRNVTVDLATSKAMPEDTAAGAAASASTAPTTSDDAAHDALDPPASPSASVDQQGTARRAAAAPTITTLQAQQPATTAPVETRTSSPKSAPMEARPTTERTDGSHHDWAVQLGSFASRANAEKLDRRLKTKGLPAYLFASGRGRELRYKVRIGPLADRAAADKMVLRVRKEGHSGGVIAP